VGKVRCGFPVVDGRRSTRQPRPSAVSSSRVLGTVNVSGQGQARCVRGAVVGCRWAAIRLRVGGRPGALLRRQGNGDAFDGLREAIAKHFQKSRTHIGYKTVDDRNGAGADGTGSGHCLCPSGRQRGRRRRYVEHDRLTSGYDGGPARPATDVAALVGGSGPPLLRLGGQLRQCSEFVGGEDASGTGRDLR